MELVRQDDEVVQMRGDLHISEAEELRKALLGELVERTALTLDLSRVNGCDTAGFQLLCALHKSAERDGKALQIFSPSAAVREASATIGLSLEELTNVSQS